jgi:hypothetical protein
MKFPKQVSWKFAIVLVLVASLISSSVTYYVFAVSPTTPFNIGGGIYPGAPSYTVWREGSYYFAKDANGLMPSWSGGTNASYIITTCLQGNGPVLLEANIYSITSSIIINKNGTSLEGSGSSREQVYFTSAPIPLERITKGTVLRVDTSGIDAIQVIGKLFGVSIKNLAIDFNVASTGHGINCIAESGGLGLSEFEFHNIFVNDHDANHYALRMENGVLGVVELFTSFGGPLLELTSQSTTAKYGIDFNCGNIVFTQLTGWITKNISTHAIFLHRINGTGVLNLYQFNRLFIINNIGIILAYPICGLRLEHVVHSQFNMADIELWYSPYGDVVHLAATQTVSFLNPYIMYSPGGGWAAWTDCEGNTVTGGTVDVTVSDRSLKDTWIGTRLHTVDGYHKAIFVDCQLYDADVDGWFSTDGSGSANVACDGWICYKNVTAKTGMIGITRVWLTVNAADATYIVQWIGTNATHFQIHLFDVTANVAETVPKDIVWMAKYQP